MGFLDKLLGRGKKAVGEMMGDSSMRHGGASQERPAGAEDPAAEHEHITQEPSDPAAQGRAEQEDA